jgi:hypothetical protein
MTDGIKHITQVYGNKGLRKLSCPERSGLCGEQRILYKDELLNYLLPLELLE